MKQARNIPENKGEIPPSAEDVRGELERVLASEVFSASPRLQQFLSYIVEETLSGRGDRVKGKTIAADVYGRDLEKGGGAQNLVRVEARRLRRLIDEYYSDPGRANPLRIHVDSGGYTPRFTLSPLPAATLPPGRTTPAARRWLIPLATLLSALAALVMAAALLWPGDRSLTEDSPNDEAVRAALRAQSVPTLQAATLATEARGMLFPVFDTRRQELALGMFRHSIDLAPALPDGYAGAAQVLAVLALLSPDGREAERLSAEAEGMADKALELTPTSAWAIGAKGLTLAILGDDKAARENARLSLSLASDDGYVLDLVGIIAILVGSPDLAAEVAHPDRKRNGVGRFGARNIWGVSQLMLGRDRDVIAAFRGAAGSGAPISPPSLIFQAVAHHRLGQYEDARRLIDELGATWPEFPARFLAARIFRNGAPIAQEIVETLDHYGYIGPNAD